MKKRVLAIVFIIIFYIINPSESRTVVESGCIKDRRLYAINYDWWKKFNDPYLTDYICKTVQNNHSLKSATLKTKESSQSIKKQMANEFPTFSLLGNYARIKTPSADLNGVDFESTGTDAFALPLFMSYEADIFLKNHDKTKSEKKKAMAAEYEEKAMYISIVSDMAATYFNIVKLDKLIDTEKKIAEARKEIFELTKERNKSGLASTYDVTDTDKQHTISMISVNDLEKQRSILLHKLAVYTGESAENAKCLRRISYDKLTYNGKIPECLSSEIVIYRPDIMKAEADLQRAKIDIRVARKDFLPTVPVIGAVGYTALELGRLFNWDSTLGLISAGFLQNIFSGGRKIANLKIKKLQYEQLFENYKQADLQAIQEINDSLCMIKFDTKKDEENKRKYKLEEKNFKLINERYKEGITSYLQMTQYRENLLSLERDKAESKIQKFVDYISLYKAVGGKL